MYNSHEPAGTCKWDAAINNGISYTCVLQVKLSSVIKKHYNVGKTNGDLLKGNLRTFWARPCFPFFFFLSK